MTDRMDIKRAIDIVSKQGHLREEEAEMIMNEIMTGEATEAQIGSYLMGLRMKGETHDEIVGSARAMRDNSTKIPHHIDQSRLLDTCGTGGDRSGTFNISTAVAFVSAAAGVPVAKHGNRAATSKSGSADVLEALGVNLELTPDQVAQCVDNVGIGFLFAPKLHPAMKHAIGPRRQIGIRTIFNILGPLTNPAGAKRQLMGVFAADLAPTIAGVLGELGAVSAMVVNGYGGLDELTTTGPNTVAHYVDGKTETYELNPLDYGFAGANIADLLGGEPEENAHILRGVLDGMVNGPKGDVVVLNAGAALLVAGKTADLESGIELARTTIDEGAATSKLNEFIEYTQQFAL